MKSTNGQRSASKAAENVNLGLSALLDAHVKGANINGSISANGPAQIQAAQEVNSEAVEPKSEIPLSPVFKALQMAAGRRWNELAEYSEVMLSANPEQSEMRVLWVLAQFRLKRMPQSILSGPLDSASKLMLSGFQNRPDNSELKQEKEFLYSTLHEFGKDLLAHNEPALALVFLERAFGISDQARDSLLECVDANLKRISDKRGKRNEEADKKELAKLEQIKESLPRANTVKGNEQAINRSRSDKRRPSFALLAWLIGTCCLILLLAGGYYYFDFWPEANTSRITLTLTARETLPDISRAPNLKPVGTLGNLDGLLYQLDQKDDSNKTGVGPVLNQQMAENLPKAGAAQGKEVINTTYPLKMPSHDTRTEASRAAANARSLQQDTQTARNEFRNSLGSRADLRLVEVENFSAPIAFELVKRSWVMSKPSEMATPISELSSGERVWVVARVGDWFKLRSKEGTRIGYIRGAAVRSLGRSD